MIDHSHNDGIPRGHASHRHRSQAAAAVSDAQRRAPSTSTPQVRASLEYARVSRHGEVHWILRRP